MAGFRKAKEKVQLFLKLGIYGPTGSGKTFTALLFAEGLVKGTNKRIAFVDTELGTSFYGLAVPERKVHPDAFDFDVLRTRSLSTTMTEIKAIDASVYGVVVIDSITHLWQAAMDAYAGKKTKIDTIPFNAWSGIKAPYKELITHLLNAPYHVIICGRQGNEFSEDESGVLKQTGVKMKAEGETPYEPHILLRMEPERDPNRLAPIVTAIAEKDRTSLLYGKRFREPTFAMIEPCLALLGGEQVQLDSANETATKDADAIAGADKEKEMASERTMKRFLARIEGCEGAIELKAMGKEITPDLKKEMLTAHVASIREAYLAAEQRVGKGV